MELFCRFEVHEYMDEHPRQETRTFLGNTEEEIAENAKKWAKSMTEMYSGGPTTFVKVMTKDEAEAHVREVCAYEDAHPQEDSETFKQKIWNLFYKCYG